MPAYAGRSVRLQLSALEAVAALGESGRSLIGSCQSVKCIVDPDGTFILTSNALQLLKAIKVDHPVLSTVLDSMDGVERLSGRGSSSFLFMLGAWSRSARSLLELQIPSPVLASLFGRIINCAVTGLGCVSKPLPLLWQRDEHCKGVSQSNGSGRTGGRNDTSCEAPKGRRTHTSVYSRHAIHRDRFASHVSELCRAVSPDDHMIASLLGTLCTNEADYRGRTKMDDLRLTRSSVYTETLCHVPASYCCVVEGLCFAIDDDISFAVACRLQSRGVVQRMIVIDSWSMQTASDIARKDWKDVAVQMRRLDDNASTAFDGDFLSADWTLSVCLQRLIDSKVTIVVSSSIVDRQLTDRLLDVGILPLRVSSHDRFKTLMERFPVCRNVLSNAEQPCELPTNDVFLTLVTCNDYLAKQTTKRESYGLVNLKWLENPPCDLIQTCVLTGTTKQTTRLMEERLTSRLSKLTNILESQLFLSGSGDCERACAEWLSRQTQDMFDREDDLCSLHPAFESDIAMFWPLVVTEVVSSLRSFAEHVCPESQQVVIDDLISKQTAWREAVKVLMLIVQCDAMITNQ